MQLPVPLSARAISVRASIAGLKPAPRFPGSAAAGMVAYTVTMTATSSPMTALRRRRRATERVPVLLSGRKILRNMLSPFLYANHEHRMTDTWCIVSAASYHSSISRGYIRHAMPRNIAVGTLREDEGHATKCRRQRQVWERRENGLRPWQGVRAVARQTLCQYARRYGR